MGEGPMGVVILGSTGSIGRQAVEVIAGMPERLRAVALGAARDGRRLLEQVRRLRPEAVALEDPDAGRAWRPALEREGVRVLVGPGSAEELATWPGAERVLVAITGAAGLRPTLAALRAGRDVALANKESLVAAGALVTAQAAAAGVRLLPVDSEHSALFQCLAGRSPAEVERLILTASGGPFRGWRPEALRDVTPEQAVRHPNWSMGAKISVDCATLMNKGLEVIEAHWLFGLPASRIGVVVHPQSVVHGLVELRDGAMVAVLARPDMRQPIQYALCYPERGPRLVDRLDLAAVGKLTFEEPDTRTFPCLALAYRALETGGTAPAVLNAANEEAVAAFLAGRLPFPGIAETVAAVLDRHRARPVTGLDDVLEADAWAREEARAQMAGPPRTAVGPGGAASPPA
ncbi:1-deoxy-D-xylulose-5-phosphate reductoisomerase [Thermaerobacter composti]|uniref:1-deoxy-D-xylulose 5-phosphate reductoisomerase n=1 Tax=Thermaerobacter composti TaxID=554949 RepID=A0ABZ0QT44_9FIRM|nr:1-deoxy-D-xylulose-5-phosphate reductoisomerase [Thermaerobacter composti]WPD19997.1 1-deoxy-D-xylulose-5-phosphate reductoisomerase [Thermaerobacter composti]